MVKTGTSKILLAGCIIIIPLTAAAQPPSAESAPSSQSSNLPQTPSQNNSGSGSGSSSQSWINSLLSILSSIQSEYPRMKPKDLIFHSDGKSPSAQNLAATNTSADPCSGSFTQAELPYTKVNEYFSCFNSNNSDSDSTPSSSQFIVNTSDIQGIHLAYSSYTEESFNKRVESRSLYEHDSERSMHTR